MSQYIVSAIKKRISLSAYISLLLVATAIIPLLVTIASVETFLRPALISQISGDMARDTQTQVQLLDTYLAERLNDIKTLSESDPIASVLTGNQRNRPIATNLLFTTLHRDIADYMSLSLLTLQGNIVLAYPAAPQSHGNTLVQPDLLPQLQTSSKVLVSDVFFDPLANNPSIDLYVRVTDANLRPVGIVRASLSLHRLWQPVDTTPQTEGTGSFAFVLDQHGMRIAYTNPDRSGFRHPSYLFQAIAPLPADFQRRIKDENLYGSNSIPVSSIPDPALATRQEDTQSPLIFQFDPTGQGQTFEAVRYKSTVVPWTYFVLKPLPMVTGLADQQLLSVILVVSCIILLALLVGTLVGRRITKPIMHSVASIRKNSVALKSLADEGQVVATEQVWMVEASQIALQSIKYYTYAASIAAQRLSTITKEIAQESHGLQANRMQKALSEMAEAAVYIDLAVKHQDNANEKLAAALRVTTRATEQLTHGARSTDDAATQLEYIVRQLMNVVGEEETNNDIPGILDDLHL